MALTHTIAGYRTALAAWDTAFTAAKGAVPTSALWDTVRAEYGTCAATWAGLPEDLKIEAGSLRLSHPNVLKIALDDAIAHEERKLRASANRRLIRARTSFGR